MTTLKLKPFQAAALVGNMSYESTAFERRGSPRLVANLGEYGKGGGYGIAQWTLAARQTSLAEFAEKNKLSKANFGLQLAYAAHELATKGASRFGALISPDTLELLRRARSIDEAVAIVQVGFERSGGQDKHDFQRVPPFKSAEQLLSESNYPRLPPEKTGTNKATYWDRLADAKRVLHER
jgi:hypothetical protein